MGKKIVVLGNNEVGCIVAALLHNGRQDVTLVSETDQDFQQIEETGISIYLQGEKQNIKVPTLRSYEQLSQDIDVVITSIRNKETARIIPEIQKKVKDGGCVLCLQSGMPEKEFLKEAVYLRHTPRVSIIFGLVFIDMAYEVFRNCLDPERIQFEVGEFLAIPSDRVKEVVTILGESFRVQMRPFIKMYMWYHYLNEVALNSVGALTGHTFEEMLKDEDEKRLVLKAYTEAYDISLLDDATYPSKMFEKFIKPEQILARHEAAVKDSLFYLDKILEKNKEKKSLIAVGLERGKASDVDNWSGFISALGKVYQKATPLNDAITEMIKEVELGNRKVSIDNIKELKDKGISSFFQEYYESVLDEYANVRHTIQWPKSTFGLALSDNYTQAFFEPFSPKWKFKPFVIKVATTGAYVMPTLNPHQPLKPESIIQQVIDCHEMGACACHVHVRCSHGAHTLSLDAFHKVIDPIRKKFGRENLLMDGCPEGGKTFLEACGPLVEFKDDWETSPLTCSAGWLGNFLWCPTTCEATQGMAKVMVDLGIKPEIVCHDMGDIDCARRWLIETGIIKKPYYFRVCMGQPGWGTISSTKAIFDTYRSACDRILEIDPDSKVMISMSGRAGIWGVLIAAMYGDPIIGARIGMEDSSWMRPVDDDIIVDNQSIMKNVMELLNLIGRKTATANEYREMLGLEKKYD